jgi:hypothetical protein
VAQGIVFPIVLIPTYAVPRAFLVHSYSLIALLRRQLRFQKNGPACPERVARRVLAIGPGARAMERAVTDLRAMTASFELMRP